MLNRSGGFNYAVIDDITNTLCVDQLPAEEQRATRALRRVAAHESENDTMRNGMDACQRRIETPS